MPYFRVFGTGAALPSWLCLPLRRIEGRPCCGPFDCAALGGHSGVFRPGAADEVPGEVDDGLTSWGHHGDILSGASRIGHEIVLFTDLAATRLQHMLNFTGGLGKR